LNEEVRIEHSKKRMIGPEIDGDDLCSKGVVHLDIGPEGNIQVSKTLVVVVFGARCGVRNILHIFATAVNVQVVSLLFLGCTRSCLGGLGCFPLVPMYVSLLPGRFGKGEVEEMQINTQEHTVRYLVHLW
jgi:hypothetical protein